jgi:membrane protease YdiL (CAAX protease family)
MERKLARPGFGMATLLVLLVLGVQVVLAVPLGIADVICMSVLHQPSPQLERQPLILGGINVVACGAAIALGLYLNRLPPRRAFPLGRITFPQLAGAAIIVFGTGLLLSAAENVLGALLPPPQWLLNVFYSHDSFSSRVLLLVIIAPLTEEPLFRGIILRGLLSRHRPATAVALTALLFAALHLNPWQSLFAFFLGVMFGWIYLRTGSLALAVLAHAMNNALAVFFTLVPWKIPGLTGTPDFSTPVFQPWWVDLCGLVALLAGIWIFRRATPPEAETPPSIPPPLPS